MGKTYDQIDDKLADFIRKQQMFFVATAPLSEEGHINVSPKGLDSFVILGPNKVAYLDLGGSGIETHAHLQENGRITIMFCAFDGMANIVRLYGKGVSVEPGQPGFDDLLAKFPDFPRCRSIMRIRVDRVSDSCGWGVPLFDYKGQRDQLPRYQETKDDQQWATTLQKYNSESIDGLAGLASLSGKPAE